MQIDKMSQINPIEEVKILSDIRVIKSHSLTSIETRENITVQFTLDGDFVGLINCYLCLDKQELEPSEKNYLYPLFVEAMNILIGKQLSTDPLLCNLNIKLSPPKVSILSTTVNSRDKQSLHKYQLEIRDTEYDVLVEYLVRGVH